MSQLTQKINEKLESSKTARRIRRHWLSIAFISGFTTDILLLDKVDDLLDNLILLFYVVLSVVSILTLYAGLAEKLFNERISYLAGTYSPLAIQYSFGGLLSGMLIFYGRSGDLIASWPFLVVLSAVILGNEVIRDRKKRLVFNLGCFFTGFLPYLVLVVSVFSGYMGVWVFVGSGLAALLFMYALVRVLALIIPRFLAMQMRVLVFTIGSIYVAFNGLYFLNIIPPIPLSLQEVGIYHGIVRFETGDYQVRYVSPSRWRFWQSSDPVLYGQTGASAVCFARVFAPGQLSTDIVHHWQYHDPAQRSWQTHARVSYSIYGTGERGYRGYSRISNYHPGVWRCSVETERGQVLGREKFIIDNSTMPPREMVTEIR